MTHLKIANGLCLLLDEAYLHLHTNFFTSPSIIIVTWVLEIETDHRIVK
jgi:hypothetical protein